MRNQSKNQLADLVILALSLFWIFWLFSDYCSKQLLYFVALDKFLFLNFLLKTGLLVGLNLLLLRWGRSRNQFWMVSGLWLVFQGLLLVTLATQAVYTVAIEPLSGNFANHPFRPIVHLLSGLAGPAFFLIVSFASGSSLVHLLKVRFRKDDEVVLNLMIGFGVWMIILFLLGTVDALKAVVIIPLGLASIGIRFKVVIGWLKNLLITPQVAFAGKVHAGGVVAILTITMLVSINLMRIQTPFPTGSDALIYYINLAQLIGNEEGLVRGFQPHYYSLITALGYSIGNGTPSALVFSMLGGVLSLPVLYRIGRSVIGMPVNVTLFALLLIYLIPTIVVQSIAELKIDLGLLFMSSATLLLFVYTLREKPESLLDRLMLTALLGLACGWLMGIKLTSVFLIVALVSGLWYHKAGLTGLSAAGFLSFGLSFLFGIDRIYEIDVVHLSRSAVFGICIIAGTTSAIILFIKQRSIFVSLMRESVVFALVTLLTFSPWLVKNYTETQRLDARSLTQGAIPGKDLNLNLLRRNMENE